MDMRITGRRRTRNTIPTRKNVTTQNQGLRHPLARDPPRVLARAKAPPEDIVPTENDLEGLSRHHHDRDTRAAAAAAVVVVAVALVSKTIPS